MSAVSNCNFKIIYLITAAFILLLCNSKITFGAAVGPYQLENKVPNLIQQFLSFQHHGEPVSFRLGAGYNSIVTCRHYQGIARSYGYGTPYLFLTRSGVHTGGCIFSTTDKPGELLIAKMESRNDMGECL